jgi:hypothetical protein
MRAPTSWRQIGRRRWAALRRVPSVRRGGDGVIGVNLASLALVLAAPTVLRAFAPLVEEPRGSFISFMAARLGVLVATTLSWRAWVVVPPRMGHDKHRFRA